LDERRRFYITVFGVGIVEIVSGTLGAVWIKFARITYGMLFLKGLLSKIAFLSEIMSD